MALGIAIACALAFSMTNGFHDADNAVATHARRGARPAQALALSAFFNVVGALVVGIVTVPPSSA